VVDEHQLEKEFAFRDFRQALDFTNQVGALAESLDHHPDIHLAWGKTRIVTWTHSAGGLTEKDFTLAARIDALPRPQP
jgi:4a-hydroxytetrahydrobiopterin dehydratase